MRGRTFFSRVPNKSTLAAFLFALALAATGPEESRAEPPEPEGPTHVYADGFLLWIYKQPARDIAPIGYIRAGDSVRLRADGSRPPGAVVKRGCGKGWYAVEPAGYVCLDHTASLERTRYSASMETLAARPGPYPFDFALSMGAPSYRRIPTQSEWTRKERIFGDAKPRPLPPHWRGHEELVTDDTLDLSPMPNFLANGGSVARLPEGRLVRRDVPFGSMLAVTSSFESEGRRFLQSADGTVVSAERFRVFRRSNFEGVELSNEESDGWTLPLAWPRKKTRLYSISKSEACAVDGSKTKTRPTIEERGSPGKLGSSPAQLPAECLIKEETWANTRTPTQLSGRVLDVAGTRFVEVGHAPSTDSTWIPLRYVFLAEKRSRRATLGTDAKWIHFSISQGTLVTYAGDQPLFATLASPGIGGVPAPGADPLSTRTTPVGTYRIQFKHRTDDMSPEQTEDRSFWIADVPYAMYFKQPFAIHVAYWHESFGEPMSGGCVNVSPKDGHRLFSFADPPLPEGWYGVGASQAFGFGTSVVIDR